MDGQDANVQILAARTWLTESCGRMKKLQSTLQDVEVIISRLPSNLALPLFPEQKPRHSVAASLPSNTIETRSIRLFQCYSQMPFMINPYCQYYTAAPFAALLAAGGFVGSDNHSPKQRQSITNTIGCRTPMPCDFAIAPVMNGNVQPPALPSAHANPTAATCRCFGRILVCAITASGNNGPRKKPRHVTATADATKLSTV